MNTFKVLKPILIIIIIAFSSTLYFAQEQDHILKKLDSENGFDRLQALGIIEDGKLTQYAGHLEERIFSQNDPFYTYAFFRTLEVINSPNLYAITKKFIDTIDYYPNVDKRIDRLKAKAIAAGVLIDFNDYSKANLIFEIIDRDKQQQTITPGMIAMLSKLLYNPVFENQAKEELLYFFDNYNYKSMSDGLSNPRSGILAFLKDKYGLGIKDLLINSFLYDPSVSIRGASLNYLSELNYSGLDSLLIYKLYMDSDSIMRPQVALTISTRLNTPQRYYILKNYRPPIQNEHRTQGIATYLSTVKPKPPKTENIIQHIDTTSGFVDVLLNYTWLGDLQFKDDLQSILQSAQSNLQAGDSLACRVQVQAFQDLVDMVYKDSLNTDPRFVTIEGWKFLYWNAQYILDRLPEPPVVFTLSLEVINPAMSLVNPGAFTMEVKGSGFSSSSVVYFNSNARATTYVADTLLTAQILATDVSVAGNYPVWVSSGTTNSDTLIYKVVSTFPQPVRPVLECVTNNGDGTYTAFFGYKNDNDVSVYIPIGSRNKFTPNPQDRGQTRVFLPGRHYKVYTVNFNGSNLVWTLNGRTSTASSNSAPCN